MNHKVLVQRTLQNRLSDQSIRKQVDDLIRRALGGRRRAGWESRYTISTSAKDEKWIFTATVTFECKNKSPSVLGKWPEIAKYLSLAGNRSKFGRYPWRITEGVDDIETVKVIESSKPAGIKDVKDYADIGVNREGFFDNIYDRDNQITIILSSIQAAIRSDFKNRFHCVLHGPPACGKTAILSSVGKMLGKENEHYMVFDATSTTEAGAARLLLESPVIPPVLIVEEIEKAKEDSLRWLLGVLDQRAEIRRTNFRIGNQARNVRMLCLATVNDMSLFSKVMSGALVSRFAYELYCPRPDRELLKKILEREIKATKGGRIEWVEPALKFCHDELDMNDPRKIVPVCLSGGDDLLDGTFQKAFRAVMQPKEMK